MARQLLTTAGLLLLCIAASGCEGRGNGEWRPFGVCFREAEAGATSRHRTFTPVRCDEPEGPVLGETVGADHGRLRFEDLDGDGRDEAVVESSASRCKTAATPCYDAWRIVMTYDSAGQPPVKVQSRTLLKELTPEG